MVWLLAALIAVLLLPSVAERLQFAITRGQERAKAEVAKELLADLPEGVGRLAVVAKSIEPSVVGIETVQIVRQRGFSDEYSQLFPQSGEGSGVIVDEAGYIVTNSHVIDRAAQLTVKLSDGRTIRNAKLVGADPLADLAVLKIDAEGLTAAPWGDSNRLEVGDEVLAVGNPYGLARTVTSGIISAKDRPGVVGSLGHLGFLQTDAAVNPGNSGGPLVNLRGEVVGINTAIFGRSYQGISFAIPSKVAQEVYQRLRETGKVAPRGWLGVAMRDVTDQIAEQYDLEEVRGVQVTAVVTGSPAEDAGIEPGDVILQWNGQKIDQLRDLSLAVVRTEVGSEATVVLLRAGRKVEIAVTVGERPLR